MFRYLKPYPNAVSNGAAAGAARRGRAAPRRRPTAYLASRAAVGVGEPFARRSSCELGVKLT